MHPASISNGVVSIASNALDPRNNRESLGARLRTNNVNDLSNMDRAYSNRVSTQESVLRNRSSLSTQRIVHWTSSDLPLTQDQKLAPPNDYNGFNNEYGCMRRAALVNSTSKNMVLRFPFAIIGGVLFAFSCFGALLLALCLHAIVGTFSSTQCRRLLCAYIAAPLVDVAALLLPRTRVHICGDLEEFCGNLPGIANAAVIGGQGLGFGWWTLLLAMRETGARGLIKAPLEQNILTLPLLGWILKLLDCPNKEDQESVKRCLDTLVQDTIANGIPYLFVNFQTEDDSKSSSFVEGLDLSICLKALKISHHVFYDITMVVEGTRVADKLNNWMYLKSLMLESRETHVYIKRYFLEDIEGNEHWEEDRRSIRSRVLSNLARHGVLTLDVPRGIFQKAVCTDTRSPESIEAGVLALARLLLAPPLLPPVAIASLPVLAVVGMACLAWHTFCRLMKAIWGKILNASPNNPNSGEDFDDEDTQSVCESRSITPWWFVPITPLNTPNPFLMGGLRRACVAGTTN